MAARRSRRSRISAPGRAGAREAQSWLRKGKAAEAAEAFLSAARGADLEEAETYRYNAAFAYWQAKEVDRLLKLYSGNTNSVYKAAVDTVYTANERAQLGAIAVKFAALVADIEANHRDVAGVE